MSGRGPDSRGTEGCPAGVRGNLTSTAAAPTSSPTFPMYQYVTGALADGLDDIRDHWGMRHCDKPEGEVDNNEFVPVSNEFVPGGWLQERHGRILSA